MERDAVGVFSLVFSDVIITLGLFVYCLCITKDTVQPPLLLVQIITILKKWCCLTKDSLIHFHRFSFKTRATSPFD